MPWCGVVALDVGITDAGTTDGVEHGTWRIPEGALRRAESYAKRKVTNFEKVKAINPPLGFDYRPIVFESTSARGPEAAAWWREITGLAKDKESGFGLGYGPLMEYNGYMRGRDIRETLGHALIVEAYAVDTPLQSW